MIYWTSLWALVFWTAMSALGCGNNPLRSVTVTPPAADARDFPNGQVQFTAIGTYSGSSHMVPVKNLSWCIGTDSGKCNGNIASAGAVDGNGLAQCVASRTGTVTVIAGTGGPMSPPDTGHQFAVFGSAHLTCP